MLRSAVLVSALLASASVFVSSAHADTDPAQDAAARRYQACVSAVEADPQQAIETASAWRDNGGGVPAKHCLGLALFDAGKPKNAALAFSQAAGDLESGKNQLLGGPIRPTPQTIAALYGQAGNASLVADDPAAAYQHFSRALALIDTLPGQQRGNLLIDRARALAGMKDYKLAAADLDKAVSDLPNSIDARLLRAAARRTLGDVTGARTDIAHAAKLAPNEPEVLLERATLAALAGDIAAARADWQAILKLAPGTDAATLARTNLDQVPAAESGQEQTPEQE